jgi:ATP-dependent Lon protease
VTPAKEEFSRFELSFAAWLFLGIDILPSVASKNAVDAYDTMLPVMTQQTKSRKEKLQEFVAAHPGDAFARYGLALECAREGANDDAISNFNELLTAHKDYVTGYFQLGQLFARLGRNEDARHTFESGIAAAERTGDSHAASEISAALADLPRWNRIGWRAIDMKSERIPLFPLNIVLLPGAALPLHIFEPRYKEMIARCIEEKIAFSIVYSPPSGIAQTGCTAEIRQILRTHPDGRMDILTDGKDVVRIIRILDEKPYFEALVQYLEEEPAAIATSTSDRETLIEMFQKCHVKAFGSPSTLAANFPDDLLSYRLAAELPIDLPRKQELLEMRSEKERRVLLTTIFTEWLPKFDRAEQARSRAAGNGHSPHW